METIKHYSKVIPRFSDDGIYFNGAYGPKVIDQLTYICDSLITDLYSRQSVINIWRENPRPSKDIPCTISLQFLVRDNRLNCVATMRSSDAWLGWVYDVFNFSMISKYIIEMLKQRAPLAFEYLQLGDLTLTAGSQHLYETDLEAVDRILLDPFALADYYPGAQRADDTDNIIDYLCYMKNMGENVKCGPDGFLDDLFMDVYLRGETVDGKA